MIDEAPGLRRPLRWQQATIVDIVRRTRTVSSFFFKLPRPFAFRAGQHVDVRLTAPDGYQAQRSYSIASAPGATDVIELAIERLEEGEVSPFFHDVARTGDEIELRGPIGGHFIWSAIEGGPILLVGGGSGVVPLMSMIRHRAAERSMAAMLLLFSARTWDDVIYRDELLSLHDLRDGFELALALTREAAHRARDFGRRIDAVMLRDVLARQPQPRQVYVCGSNPFVEAASQSLIEADTPAGIIRTERYGS
jgi:ferredoxin-NADP reductase